MRNAGTFILSQAGRDQKVFPDLGIGESVQHSAPDSEIKAYNDRGRYDKKKARDVNQVTDLKRFIDKEMAPSIFGKDILKQRLKRRHEKHDSRFELGCQKYFLEGIISAKQTGDF